MTKSERELLLALAQVLRIGRRDIGALLDRVAEPDDKSTEAKAPARPHHHK